MVSSVFTAGPHFKPRDVHLFKAPYSSSRHRITHHHLLYPHASRRLSRTSDVSNPSPNGPFMSSPAEIIILDLIIPPSPLQLCFLLFQRLRAIYSFTIPWTILYAFPSTYRRLSLSLSFPFTHCALAQGAVFLSDLYRSLAVCLINSASRPGDSPNPDSLWGARK